MSFRCGVRAHKGIVDLPKKKEGGALFSAPPLLIPPGGELAKQKSLQAGLRSASYPMKGVIKQLFLCNNGTIRDILK